MSITSDSSMFHFLNGSINEQNLSERIVFATEKNKEDLFEACLSFIKGLPSDMITFDAIKISELLDLEPKIKEVNLLFYLNHFEKINPPNYPFRDQVFNELISSQPDLAVEYALQFTLDGTSHVSDKQSLSDAIETYCLPNNPEKALRLATDLNNLDLAEKALAAGANDVPIYGVAPLLRACKYADAELVIKLLKNGYNPKVLGGTHEHETPLSEARLRLHVMSDCLPLLTEIDDGFTDEIMSIKLLAHKFSCKTVVKVDGREFYVEGFRPRYIVDDYVKKNAFFYTELKREFLQGGGTIYDSFSEKSRQCLQRLLEDPLKREKFLHVIDTTFSTIEHCLDHEGKDLDADGGRLKNQFLHNLNEGKPVVCFGVTKTEKAWKTNGDGVHAWGLVVLKDLVSKNYLVHRCNRGYGSESLRGLRIGKFNEEEMFNIVKEYQRLSNWKTSLKSDADYFLSQLDTKLIYFSKTLIKDLKQKEQSVGNCSYYSLQSIELALLKSQLSQVLGDDEGCALAKEIKNIRTTQMRLKDLECYLESHLPGGSRYPVNWELLNDIFMKVSSKDKLVPYRDLILNFAQRALARGYPSDQIPQSIINV